MAFFRTGGGTDTSDANATAADILLNKTAYVDDEKIIGTMANLGSISHTIGAGEVYNVPAGYTSGGVITAIAAGATITVTYTSDFYNKTMTCTKGQTTYTQTTTSSGSTTFSVAESGTWTITCNGVSRTVDVVLEYTTQMAITQTVTVYSAASDTVSFTDVTGAKTVTTDTSGQGSVSISFIPNSTITFTSSYAKNPSDTSQAYSKTITMTDSISSIYIMPDGALYWYGWRNPNFSIVLDNSGQTYYCNGTINYLTNYINMDTGKPNAGSIAGAWYKSTFSTGSYTTLKWHIKDCYSGYSIPISWEGVYVGYPPGTSNYGETSAKPANEVLHHSVTPNTTFTTVITNNSTSNTAFANAFVNTYALWLE